MRLAPTRLVPFSYFWICWDVRPSASPSFSWLIPSIMRRILTRLPTYLSTGFGALVDISNSPCDQSGKEANEADEVLDTCAVGSCSEIGKDDGRMSNEPIGPYWRATQCELQPRSVNYWIFTSRRFLVNVEN